MISIRLSLIVLYFDLLAHQEHEEETLRKIINLYKLKQINKIKIMDSH